MGTLHLLWLHLPNPLSRIIPRRRCLTEVYHSMYDCISGIIGIGCINLSRTLQLYDSRFSTLPQRFNVSTVHTIYTVFASNSNLIRFHRQTSTSLFSPLSSNLCIPTGVHPAAAKICPLSSSCIPAQPSVQVASHLELTMEKISHHA